MSDEDLTLYVVYENATDYPGKFVIRRNIVPRSSSFDRAGVRVIVADRPDFIADSYDELAVWLWPKIRDLGLTRLDRDPTHPPQIREVWF